LSEQRNQDSFLIQGFNFKTAYEQANMLYEKTKIVTISRACSIWSVKLRRKNNSYILTLVAPQRAKKHESGTMCVLVKEEL
jgi:hypothetical protein